MFLNVYKIKKMYKTTRKTNCLLGDGVFEM